MSSWVAFTAAHVHYVAGVIPGMIDISVTPVRVRRSDARTLPVGVR